MKMHLGEEVNCLFAKRKNTTPLREREKSSLLKIEAITINLLFVPFGDL